MKTLSKPFSYFLLADDDEDDRFFFREVIQEIDPNFIVDTVNDGEQLMNYLRSREMEHPQLLFLDLNMPRKGGMECLQEIRNDETLKAMVVAIYSTSSASRDIERAFKEGADMYIRKPNDFDSLRKMMAELVKMDWEKHIRELTIENYLR